MTDRTALLNELKIDRDAPTEPSSARRWLVLLAVAIVAAGAAWWYMGGGATAATVTVRTSPATPAAAAEQAGTSVLDATGYVVARRQATVSSKATGKVLEVLIEEGVQVEANQLLARLDDSIPRAQYELARAQVAAARAAIAELDVQVQQAQLDLTRVQGLAERSLASTADLDRAQLGVAALEARRSRAERDIDVAESALAVQSRLLEDMEIRAPFAGVIVAKAAQPGEMISPVSAGGGFTRTGICTIVDMDSLEVEIDVNESYINRVAAAQPVEVTLNAYPEQRYQARVIAIIPAADRNKATVRVRVGLTSPDNRVLPDMGVRVAFLDTTAAPVDPAARSTPAVGVLVPASAIGTDASGSFVYLATDGRAERRPVRTGSGSDGNGYGNRVLVLTGLAAGERVITGLTADLQARLASGPPITEQN